MPAESTITSTAAPPVVRYALVDGAALTPDQRLLLPEHGEDACWVYAELNDPQAREMGPVLSRATPAAMKLVKQLWDEPATCWAATLVESSLPWHLVKRRVSWLRHVHTDDGQRYFFRFADSRCFVAMCEALAPQRRQHLLAGWRAWRIRGRNAEAIEIRGEPAAEFLTFPLCLTASELGALLDLSWPDQLLASARECVPTLRDATNDAQQYDWMQRLCGLFRTQKVEAYPVQLAAAIKVLESAGQALLDEDFAASLRRAQQENEIEGA